MKKQFAIRRLIVLMSMMSAGGLASNTFASGFQLWEQDGASVGDYHAGRAAAAEDASTNVYNPAGLVRIHNQQLVVGAAPTFTSFIYKGTVAVNTLNDNAPAAVTSQGGGFNLVPNLHYAAPINDQVVFGFSVTSPFGFKTNYGGNTDLRYAATFSSLQVVDTTPSLGVAINDHLSLGAGLDVERASSEFDWAAALSGSPDTDTKAEGWSTALGYHLGVLYQVSDQTRFGVSYQSKVKHTLRGHSSFAGPLAEDEVGGTQYAGNYFTKLTLPATTSVSVFHALNQRLDLMGTISYTQWSVFNDIVMQNVTGYQNNTTSSNMTVVVPENYHNTWNYSVGGNWHINPQLFFRAGVGYDQSPTNNADRNIMLPDSDRVAVALGGHFQATQSVGLDLGWTHFFQVNPSINNVVQTAGDQETTTNGSVKANTDVYGIQVKWDIT